MSLRAANNGDLTLLLGIALVLALLVLLQRSYLHRCVAESYDVTNVQALRTDDGAHGIVWDVQVSCFLLNKNVDVIIQFIKFL